jgi:CubicO group peptidase (beta-lactamase class C family)
MIPNPIISRLAHGIAVAVLTLVIFLTTVTASARSIPAIPNTPDFAAIDTYVESQMGAMRIPGLALGIVHGDQIVYLKGYGVADSAGHAVTPQTPFRIGSISKTFTALAVMQLVEAGKIDLDAPVQRYLPWWHVADVEASAQITVHQLLMMSSGLTDALDRKHWADRDTSEAALEHLVRDLSTDELDRPVGSRFEYSNPGYWTLGLVVQAVSGQSFETYVQEHIFAPLEMHHSFTSITEAGPYGLATGHQYMFGYPYPTHFAAPRGLIPSTGLIVSAEDMTHFLIANLNAGRYSQAAILSADGIAAMQQPAIARGIPDTSWGLGWEIGPINGIPAVYRWGNGSNLHGKIVLIPESGWGVVVLENTYPLLARMLGDRRIDQTAEGVASLLLGIQPPEPKTGTSIWIVYGFVLVFVTAEFFGLRRSVLALRRWRAQPERRPRGGWGVVWQILLPFVVYLALGLALLIGLPRLIFGSLANLLIALPDIGYVLLVSGVIAIAWSFLWLTLAFFPFRRINPPIPSGERVQP